MSNLFSRDINLKNYSWFNLGGKAKNFFKPKKYTDLINFLNKKNDRNN